MMNTENSNLEFLKKSKKQLHPGDIFVLKPRGRDYYFGRVINTDANCGFGTGGAILIYIYNATSKDKSKIPDLEKDNLLIPPCFVNKLGWSRGFFENVGHRELSEEEVHNIHCFWSPQIKLKERVIRETRYMNEMGQELDGPHEPMGQYGLANYRIVDDEVSRALGIPLAPD